MVEIKHVVFVAVLFFDFFFTVVFFAFFLLVCVRKECAPLNVTIYTRYEYIVLLYTEDFSQCCAQ